MADRFSRFNEDRDFQVTAAPRERAGPDSTPGGRGPLRPGRAFPPPPRQIPLLTPGGALCAGPAAGNDTKARTRGAGAGCQGDPREGGSGQRPRSGGGAGGERPRGRGRRGVPPAEVALTRRSVGFSVWVIIIIFFFSRSFYTVC